MASHTDPTVKHDALLLFEAIDSNPNGDPDNAGKPRTDLDTGHGLVSDVSIKRKIRDALILQAELGQIGDKDGYEIFVRRGSSREELVHEAAEAAKAANGSASERMVAEQITTRYFDIRVFGGVLAGKKGSASGGKLTGPVTVGIARTVDPVMPMELPITLSAPATAAKKEDASQMGSKTVIPYGLYVCRVHYQPTKNNQVTKEDLEVLWSTMATMFEVTRSAARPDVSVRNLFVFSHSNALGNAPAKKLIDSVTITKRTERDIPTSSADYEVAPPADDSLPEGVTLTTIV